MSPDASGGQRQQNTPRTELTSSREPTKLNLYKSVQYVLLPLSHPSSSLVLLLYKAPGVP